MKKIRMLTSARLKQLMKTGALFVAALTCFTQVAAQSMTDYTWDNMPYAKYKRVPTLPSGWSGYVDLYTNGDVFCDSSIFLPGISLLGDNIMGIVLIVVIVYLMVGLLVLSDLTMDAIHEITSATEQQVVKDAQGKEFILHVPAWNVYVAQIGLVAIASSLPEIFLCYYSYFGEGANHGNGTPLALGPVALIGSSAINLLVVSGIVIASTKASKIRRQGIFSLIYFFATFAFLWMTLVVVFFTPGQIQFTEGIITLLFYPLMLLLVWVTDTCTQEPLSHAAHTREYQRRMSKQQLIAIARAKSPEYVINMCTGSFPPDCNSFEDMDRIRHYYKIALGVDDMRGVLLENMIEVLEPESVIDRLTVRKFESSKVRSGSSFLKIHHSEFHKQFAKQTNGPVGFQSRTYSAFEGQGQVRLTVVKRTHGCFSFKVVTKDDTAVAGKDYQQMSRIFTIREDQLETDIVIDIFEDKEVELDEEFQVLLLAVDDGTLLPGPDTVATVTIIDNDNAGVIAFENEVMSVEPASGKMKVTLQRNEGGGGQAVVHVTTQTNSHLLNGYQVAQNGMDFTSLKKHQVVFQEFQRESTFEVDLPDSSLRNTNGKIPKDCEPVCFVLNLSDVHPREVQLSKRSCCLIKLEPDAEAWRQYDGRLQILKHTIYARNPFWYDQFRMACCLGPSIDSTDAIEEVSCWKAFTHCITMPWKVLFGLVPPKRYVGGWATLIFCAVLTCFMVFLIFEVLRNLNCFLGIKPTVLGLVIFAGMAAIPEINISIQMIDKDNVYDAGDIFNPILASNAVNVFLGLGLPWTISTIYNWANNNSMLILGADNSVSIALCSFSFFLFASIAGCCLGVRRFCCGTEIGGPYKFICAFFFGFLWFSFIFLNIFNDYSNIRDIDDALKPTISLSDISCPVMSAPTTINQCDEVEVSFDAPQSYAYVELQYRFVGDQAFEWQDNTINCRQRDEPQYGKVFCVSKSFLWKDEFAYDPDCRPLEVRVRGCKSDGGCCDTNDLSESTWSNPSVQPTIVMGLPKAYDLALKSTGSNEMTIGWQSQEEQTCNEVREYQLEMKKDMKEPWRDVYPQQSLFKDLEYTVSGLETCGQYYFRGRVISTCNIDGHYSKNDLHVTTQCHACNPGPVLSYRSKCSLEIDWSRCYACADDDHISNHKGPFLVEVMGVGGLYRPVPGCGDIGGSRKSCTVKMADLQSMEAGKQIAARVRPLNGAGQQIGRYTQTSTSDVVFTMEPAQVYNLEASDATSNSVRLSWTTRNPASVTEYEIEGRLGDGGNWEQFRKVWHAEQTDAIVSGLQSDSYYQFRLVSVNDCAKSDASSAQVVEIQTIFCAEERCNIAIPLPPPIIDVTARGCDLELRFSGLEQVTKYNVQVQSEDYIYHGVNCQGDNFNICTIRIEKLSEAPFFLKGSDLIMFRAQALNYDGWSPWSSPTKRASSTMRTPQAPSQPIAKWADAQQNSVTVSWNRNHNRLYSDMSDGSVNYILQWDQGTIDGLSKKWTKIYQGSEPFTNIRDIKHGYQYKFKVKAMQTCGTSGFSDEYCLKTPPGPSTTMLTNSCHGGCRTGQLSLEWSERVLEGGSDVTDNSVYVKDRTGTDRLYDCQTSGSLACHIALDQLRQSPYSLRIGDEIKMSVSSTNAIGDSIKNKVNFCSKNGQPPRIEVRPCKPNKPVDGTLQIGNTLPISWNSCATEIYGGGIDYILEWDQGANTWTTIDTRPGRYNARVQINTMRAMYQFRVTASNDCGKELSSILVVRPFHVPVIGCPVVTVHMCEVHVSWEPTSTGGADSVKASQLYYELLIQKSDGMWEPFDLKDCEQSLSTYSGAHFQSPDNRCTIAMHTLQREPWNLSVKDPVKVAVKANNELGWSDAQLNCACDVFVRSTPSRVIPAPILAQEKRDSLTVGYETCRTADADTYLMLRTGNGQWGRATGANVGNSFTMSTEMGVGYQFKIQCCNECGIEFGPPIHVNVPDLPMVPSCQIEYWQNCQFKITWQKNVLDYNPAIEKYQIAINGRLHKPCSFQSWDNSCIIHMGTVQGHPFNQRIGDKLKCSVMAKNSQGWSQWSESSESSVYVQGKPGLVAAPYKKSITTDFLQVCRTQDSRASLEVAKQTFESKKIFLWRNDGIGTQLKEPEQNDQFGLCYNQRYRIDNEYKYCKTFMYRIREHNSCGYTDSPTISIQVPAPPLPPTVSIRRVGCQIYLEWQAPKDDRCSVISRYEMKIGNSQPYSTSNTRSVYQTDKFAKLPCLGDVHQRQCIFEMKDVKEEFRQLDWGDYAKFQLKACSDEEKCGEWSPKPLDMNSIELEKAPERLEEVRVIPRSENFGTSQLQFEWDDSCQGDETTNDDVNNNPQCAYEVRLRKDERQEGVIERISDTKFIKFQPGLGCAYELCVRVVNHCGASEFTCQTDTVCAKPERPRPTCHLEGCNVRVFWRYPQDNGCEVTKYHLKVNGDYFNPCSNKMPTRNFDCLIPFETLAGDSFNLATGSPLTFSGAAHNSMGDSEVSLPCSPQIKQSGPPPQLTAFTEVIRDNTIKVCWEPRQGSGLLDDLEYELYWDNGHDGLHRQTKDPTYWITATSQKCYNVEVAGDKARYTFKVVAQNACGASSALVSQTMAKCPDRPQCVVSLLESCAVLIKWAVPFDGLSQIKKYEVAVEVAEGQWESLRCDEQTLGNVRMCEVNMSVLANPPYGLGVGETIWMKVRAQNEVGYSPWSERQPQTVRMMGTPGKMPSPRVSINSRGTTKSGEFTACWQNLFFDNTDQLSTENVYDLRWGIVQSLPSQLLYSKQETKQTCHKARITNKNGEAFGFTVRAKNACGHGPYSDVITVNWFKPPCAPGKPCSHHPNTHLHSSVLAKEIDLLDTDADEEPPLVPVPLPTVEPECIEPTQPSIECTPCPPTQRNWNLRCSNTCQCKADFHDDGQHLLMSEEDLAVAPPLSEDSGKTTSFEPGWQAQDKASQKNSPRAVSTSTSTHT